jgi:hypothetical protein
MVMIQFAQDLSLRFEMTNYLACHFERIARNLSSLYSAIHSNCTTTGFFDAAQDGWVDNRTAQC